MSLSNDQLKEARKLAVELAEQAEYEFEKERRATGLSILLDDAADQIVALLDELDRVRQVHREEQRRSAERLQAALRDRQRSREADGFSHADDWIYHP